MKKAAQPPQPTEADIQAWLYENKNLTLSELVLKVPTNQVVQCRDYFLKVEETLKAQLTQIDEVIQLCENRITSIQNELS